MKSVANKPGTSSYQEVLAIHPFRSLWIGQICSQIAINTFLFVLALRVYQNTGSNTAVSGIFLSFGIPGVLFGMIAGTIVDHLDKRRILIYCDIVRGLLILTLLFFSGNIAYVYVVTFINAVITQFYVPAEAPTIPRLVPSHLLVPANSLFSFTFYSSLALGSVFAGPLLRVFGPFWIFLLLGLLFFAAALSVYQLPSQAYGVYGFTSVLKRNIFRVMNRIGHDLVAGVSYVSKSRVLLDGLLLLTGTQIILAMLGTLGPGFADKILAVDVRDASLLVVGPAVAGIVMGALWVGSVGFKLAKPQQFIKIGILSAGGVLLTLSLVVALRNVSAVSFLFSGSTRIIMAFTLFFLLGVANSFLDVPANSVLQENTKGEMRGRVYGMLTAAVGGVGVLPVMIGGVLADVVGVGKVVFLLGLIIFLYGLYPDEV